MNTLLQMTLLQLAPLDMLQWEPNHALPTVLQSAMFTILKIQTFIVGVTLRVDLRDMRGMEHGIDVVLVDHLHHMILTESTVHCCENALCISVRRRPEL